MPGLSSLQVNIKDQPHNLAWINKEEQALLKDLGGSGRPGPMGIPAYYSEGTDDNDEGEGEGESGHGAGGGSGGSGGSGGGSGGSGGGSGGSGGGSGGDGDDGFDTDKDEDFDFEQGPEGAEAAGTDDIASQMGWGDPGAMSFSEADLEDYESASAPDDITNQMGWGDPGFIGPGPEDVEGPYEDPPFVSTSPFGVKSPYTTTVQTPADPVAAAIINTMFGLAVPGAGIARLAGFDPGAMLASKSTYSYPSTSTGDPISSYEDPYDPEDEFGDREFIEEEKTVKEASSEEDEEVLGAMEEYFKNKEDSMPTVPIDEDDNVLSNIVEKLTIQNKILEPFDQWLSKQMQSMKNADLTTQVNEYRKYLRDMTPTSKLYKPNILSPTKKTGYYSNDQNLLNTLYQPFKKKSATEALFDELGID